MKRCLRCESTSTKRYRVAGFLYMMRYCEDCGHSIRMCEVNGKVHYNESFEWREIPDGHLFSSLKEIM